MTDIVVGVDLGTTDTKVLLTSPDGIECGFARRPTPWTTTREGRHETTGAALTETALLTIRDALDELDTWTGTTHRVVGIGIAGLAESGVVLDPHGAESSPVIAWFDERGGAELRAADPAFVAAFPGRTGLPVGSQWTLPKLLWLRAAGHPLTRGSRWLSVPEFLAWMLCGEQVGEPSLVSRTGLVAQATMTPWEDALAVAGLASDFLPPLLDAGRPAGRVSSCPAVPRLVGAVVTVAGHDHPVAALGAGATGPRDLFDSCGTAEVLLRSVPRVLDDAERATLVGLAIDAGHHVVTGQTVLIGGMRSGLVMRRILALIGAHGAAGRDRLDRDWTDAPHARDHVTIHGAAIHHNDVTITLRDGATPDLAWAATLQHLAEQTSTLLAHINGVVGSYRSAVAAGGWTRMRSVRESKLATIPRLSFCQVDQPGARGAALLAACAASGDDRIDGRAAAFAATVCRSPSSPDGPEPHDHGADGAGTTHDRHEEGLSRR